MIVHYSSDDLCKSDGKLMAINNPDWVELIKKDFPLTRQEWELFEANYRELYETLVDLDHLKLQIINLPILNQIRTYPNFLLEKERAFQEIFDAIEGALTPNEIYDAIHNMERNNLISKNQTLETLDPTSVRYKVHDWIVHTLWFKGKESSCGELLSQLIQQVDEILGRETQQKGLPFRF